MGTFAAGLRVLLLAVGEVSLVVHFLHIVRIDNTMESTWKEPTFCACSPKLCILPRLAGNLYRVLHAQLRCNELFVNDSIGRPWKLFS
jgi:hypothetical protein